MRIDDLVCIGTESLIILPLVNLTSKLEFFFGGFLIWFECYGCGIGKCHFLDSTSHLLFKITHKRLVIQSLELMRLRVSGLTGSRNIGWYMLLSLARAKSKSVILLL